MRIRKNHLSGDEGWTENVPSEAHSSVIGGELVVGGRAAPPMNIPAAPGNADAMKRQMDARFKALRGENVIERAENSRRYRERHRDAVNARARERYHEKKVA